MIRAAITLTVNFPQLHAMRDFTDELPTKSCFSNILILCQRSTETRLAGILLLWARFSINHFCRIYSQ